MEDSLFTSDLTTTGSSYPTPDGSLLTVHTFPQDCSSSTGTWLFGTQTTCQPLTGNYYSPAICPDEWTAAYTRPVVGGRGPPVEPGETAMYCCPSGLNSAEGDGCGEGACVSTSIVSASTGFSIELVMSRQAVQIRWASSDLSILQTHPLIPGLTLATQAPSSNYSVFPPLQTQDQVGVALAFLPLLLAIGGIILASVLLELKKQNSITTLGPRFFRPWILTQRAIVILMSFMVSAIVLVEISCQVLPTDSDVSEPVTVASPSLTKAYISEVTLKGGLSTSTPHYEVTCDTAGDYSISYITVQDERSTVTEPITVTGESSGSEITTTVCRVDDEIVELPTCYQPPTAPPPENFLNDTKATVEGAYVVGAIIPPLAAAIFALPWKILAIHASSLEPFRQLARPDGCRMSAFLHQYDGIGAFLAPLPALCLVMTYATAAVAPLAAEGWKIKLQGVCEESSSEGCTPVLIVSTPVVRTLEALLAFSIAIAFGMLVILSRWSTGLRADPRSILGIASLSHSSNFLELFTSCPRKASWWKWWRKNEPHFNQKLLHYGYHRDQLAGQQEFVILVADVLHTAAAENTTRATSRQQERRHHCTHEFPARIALTLGSFALGLAVFAVIIIYYRLAPDTQALGLFLSSQSFGPRFIFSTIGVVINFLWVSIFTRYLVFAPYLELSNGPRISSNSIALPYASDSYTYFFSSLASFRFLAIGISLSTILSDFLPLTLANIPFDRTTTWNAYVASTWVSVGLIGFMIIVLLAMVAFLLLKSHNWFIYKKKVHQNPLKFILYMLSSSPHLMECLHHLSGLNTAGRDRMVKELNLRYELIEASYEWGDRLRPRIEISSADYGTSH